MKKALIFLTTGFEEIEALATVDILRRGGIDIETVSLTDTINVEGGHGIQVIADIMFEDVSFASSDMLILPGGTIKINEHEGLKKQIEEFNDQRKYIAAICAAPMVLGKLGLLRNKKATCYPGFEKYLDGAILEMDKSVVIDGKIVTGRGPGYTLDFALQILEILDGKDVKNKIAQDLLLI